jgi:hypothetical protein
VKTRKPKFNPRNADGSFKSFDQILRSQMTVLQYGRMLAQQKGGQQ